MHDRYFLTAVASVATNNAANVQIVRRGVLQRIDLEVVADLDADLEGVAAEVSLQNAFQSSTNNAQGILGTVCLSANLTTSGAMLSRAAHSFDLDVEVVPLDIIYLNLDVPLNSSAFPGLAQARALLQVLTR